MTPMKSPAKIEARMVVPAALSANKDFNKTPRENENFFRASQPIPYTKQVSIGGKQVEFKNTMPLE